jgi:hypothetical protein
VSPVGLASPTSGASPPPFRLLSGHHAVRSTQERRQAEIDEIDAGHSERDVAGRHHALREHVIEDVQNARIRKVEERVGYGAIVARRELLGHQILPEKLSPLGLPTRSLARRVAGALRSRGSLAPSLATQGRLCNTFYSLTNVYGGQGPVRTTL